MPGSEHRDAYLQTKAIKELTTAFKNLTDVLHTLTVVLAREESDTINVIDGETGKVVRTYRRGDPEDLTPVVDITPDPKLAADLYTRLAHEHGTWTEPNEPPSRPGFGY